MRIAGRYELVARLGRGAHGEVWEADDPLTASVVAVKLLDRSAGLEPARVRREVAALRLLRLPGVVRMIDEGVDEGAAFLVMERVVGAPFPGRAGPVAWAAIEDTTVRLLQTLGRVHAAGVVHRDLKPDNVLVGGDGRPTLLDFGLSFGSLAGELTVEGMVLGTPAYLSPEQIRGERVSAETDLYAVGVMLYECLSGRRPHEGADFVELMRGRLSEPAPSLAEAAPFVPAAVSGLVDRLLSRSRAERPRCAEEALECLRGRATVVSGPPAVQGGSEVELRGLFGGPDRLFHLREDAARELWARTLGRAEEVAAEVEGWVHSGCARREGGRVVVDRAGLDDLEVERAWRPSALGSPELGAAERRAWHREAAREMAPGAAGRLFHLIAGQEELSGVGPAEVAAEAVAGALPAARAGKLGLAISLLSEGLFAARRRARRRRGASSWGEARLLGAWAQVAISDSRPRALDRALYEVCRAGERTEEVGGLEGLLRAALAVRTAGGDRALGLLDSLVEPFADPELDRFRQHVRVLAARRGPLEREEAVLEGVGAWARERGDAAAEASFLDWLGRLRYRQGRFEEAAVLHSKAARGGAWASARVDATLNAASAWMECFAFDEARNAAEHGRALAAQCRHAYFEGRAEWILRTIAYRTGRADVPDHELVELAGRVDVAFLEGAVCLTEAAVAWRAGRLDEGLALARRAERILTGKGREASGLLARCLVAVCGGGVTEGEAAALVEQAAGCHVPGIGVQALGLLCPAHAAARSALSVMRGALTAAVPRGSWGVRMDVLSVEEALSRGSTEDSPPV